MVAMIVIIKLQNFHLFTGEELRWGGWVGAVARPEGNLVARAVEHLGSWWS